MKQIKILNTRFKTINFKLDIKEISLFLETTNPILIIRNV